jgi:hypothetical protein
MRQARPGPAAGRTARVSGAARSGGRSRRGSIRVTIKVGTNLAATVTAPGPGAQPARAIMDVQAAESL